MFHAIWLVRTPDPLFWTDPFGTDLSIICTGFSRETGRKDDLGRWRFLLPGFFDRSTTQATVALPADLRQTGRWASGICGAPDLLEVVKRGGPAGQFLLEWRSVPPESSAELRRGSRRVEFRTLIARGGQGIQATMSLGVPVGSSGFQFD